MLKPNSSQLSFYGAHWFVGLAIDESPPDATSFTRFRERLGMKRFTDIFNQTLAIRHTLV